MADHATDDDPTDPADLTKSAHSTEPADPADPASAEGRAAGAQDRAPRAGAAAAADPWEAIDRLHGWLDANRARGGTEGLLLRVLKLSEEVGEVAEAVIGATGQNPRKGVSHTWDDVRSELCDVVITAMVALRDLAPDAREVFATHLAGVTDRSLGPDRSSPVTPTGSPGGPPCHVSGR